MSVAAADLAASPAFTSPALTRMGLIIGTAAYMAPEQAKGKPVDRRADVWAFGCLLFEMLTGRRAFPGEATVLAVASLGVIGAAALWRLNGEEPSIATRFSITPPAGTTLQVETNHQDLALLPARASIADGSDSRPARHRAGVPC